MSSALTTTPPGLSALGSLLPVSPIPAPLTAVRCWLVPTALPTSNSRITPRLQRPPGQPPAKPRPAPAVVRRIGALTGWRAEAAPRLGLDPGLLLPRRLIERLAELAPTDLEALEAVEGMRRWRIAALGREILAALAGPVAPAERGQDGAASRVGEREEGG